MLKYPAAPIHCHRHHPCLSRPEQLGRTNEAVKAFRTLLRRYPDFPDMRAALAAALWADGLEAQAESAW